MKIMMSAGEASGDMHAAAVAAEIKKLYPETDIFGMGGADMRKSGVRIIYDIENLGIIGLVEVIKHLPLFFKLRSFLKEAMREEKPDVLVCVDYPGFNMKLAHVARSWASPSSTTSRPPSGRGTRGGRRISSAMSSRWRPYFLLKQTHTGRRARM